MICKLTLLVTKVYSKNKQLVFASKRLKISATPTVLNCFLSTLVNISKGEPVAYNLSYFYVDKKPSEKLGKSFTK